MWATKRHRLLRAAPRWSHGEEITHCEGHCQKGVEEEIVTNIGVDDTVMSTPLKSDTSPFAEGSRAM